MSRARLDESGVVVSCGLCSSQNRVQPKSLQRTIRCGKCKAALSIDMPLEVFSSAAFDRLLQESAVPLLADFWAEWCGPCKMMEPQFVEAAAQMSGRAVFLKVETDTLPALAARLQIQSIPTLIAFVGGAEASRISGARSARDILAFIRQAQSTAPR